VKAGKMPRAIRMPSEKELPQGPRRYFVEELFFLFREAGRPTLRPICERMAADPDRAGTASRETIRQMFLGKAVPLRWANAYAVVAALASLAGRDLGEYRFPDGNNDETGLQYVRRLWNEAIDAEPPTPRPPTPSSGYRGAVEDPWSQPHSDEPPF